MNDKTLTLTDEDKLLIAIAIEEGGLLRGLSQFEAIVDWRPPADIRVMYLKKIKEIYKECTEKDWKSSVASIC